MSIASLFDVLTPAYEQNYAVGGLVVLGWEDAMAYVEAAERLNAPVILQAGPGCRKHTPIPILAKMFRHLAENASVPVVCHLDHGYTKQECIEAIDNGFSSVMFDGSMLPIDDNIEQTAEIVALAHKHGISVEGEVGFVGYSNGKQSTGTNVDEAALFAKHSGADAMAISIGNVHLQTSKDAEIDIDKVRAIEKVTQIPLVVHGGSGVPMAIRRELALTSKICKFNIGTELRMAFGAALKQSVATNTDKFDRLDLLKPVIKPIADVAEQVIKNLYK